jgi:hypothetical protein
MPLQETGGKSRTATLSFDPGLLLFNLASFFDLGYPWITFLHIFWPWITFNLGLLFFYLGLLFLNLAPSCSFSLFVCVGGLWSV